MATKNRSISSEKILKICILAEMDKANVKEHNFSFPIVPLATHEYLEDHERLLGV